MRTELLDAFFYKRAGQRMELKANAPFNKQPNIYGSRTR